MKRKVNLKKKVIYKPKGQSENIEAKPLQSKSVYSDENPLRNNIDQKSLSTKEVFKVLSGHSPLQPVKSDSFTTISEEQIKVVQLRNFEFDPRSLKVVCNTTVRWIIAENSASHESGIYSSKERFFILNICDLDIETDPLYHGGMFEYQFTTPGSFEITCANYMRVKGLIHVVSEFDDKYYKIQSNFKDRFLFTTQRDYEDLLKGRESTKLKVNTNNTDSDEDYLNNRRAMLDIEPENLKALINTFSKKKPYAEKQYAGQQKLMPSPNKIKSATIEETAIKRHLHSNSDSADDEEEDLESMGSDYDNFLNHFLSKEVSLADDSSMTDFSFLREKGLDNSACSRKKEDFKEFKGVILKEVEEPENLSNDHSDDEENSPLPLKEPANEELTKNKQGFDKFIKNTIHESFNYSDLTTVAKIAIGSESRSRHDSAMTFLKTRKHLLFNCRSYDL